jgi:hypothetical protein
MERLSCDEGQDLHIKKRRKYNVALMSSVNNVCKTMRGMNAILYKGDLPSL